MGVQENHLYTGSLIVSLSIFRLYLPAPHFAAPLHPVASEAVHLRPHTLPSHSSGRRPAETRDGHWAQRRACWSARQIWKRYWSQTNTVSLSITRRTPEYFPLSSMSPYTLAHGVNSCCFCYSCILQSASNPVWPVHDLISTLISADTGSACKSCSFFCADNFWEVSICLNNRFNGVRRCCASCFLPSFVHRRSTHLRARACKHVSVSLQSLVSLRNQWASRWGLWHWGVQLTICWNCQFLLQTHTYSQSLIPLSVP